MKKTFLAAAAAMLSIGSAQASDYALGAGLHLNFSEYKGVDAEVIPAPIMNVETEHFYIHGLEAGGYLVKTPQHTVMLGISYMPLEFDAGDSDNHAMKQLDDRDASAFANLSYSFTSQYLIFSAKISGDILGESNGILADASIAKRFQVQRLGIMPVIGATWASSNFNDYYYGISAAESKRSGLEAYEADSSVTPYARVVFDYSFNDHLSLWLEGSARWLGSEVKDSPMVEDDVRLGFGGGINWRF